MLQKTFCLLMTGLFSCACVNAGNIDPPDEQCPPANGVALQVLGSGGPIADDGRASSSYLVWVDQRARLLVDSGSGSFLRFGEAGAQFADLELIALSHFHTDHSSGLPGLLKSGNFSRRERPLHISGPSGKGPFPGLEDFLQGLLDPQIGSYRYLSGYLDGSDDLVKLELIELPHQQPMSQTVLKQDGWKVSALSVPHGIVPSMAYRVDIAGKTIVFGSDQNGGSELFADFARGADILVAHMAIPEQAGRGARSLHATPSRIGKMAAEAGASRLLLSHFMARSLESLDANLELVSRYFDQNIMVAKDLMCLVP